MEKSWENFWTTGKVEDYLNYRNRFADEETNDEKRRQEEDRKDERDSSWKGLK